MDYLGTLVRSFSKHVGEGLAIEAGTSALSEGLTMAKAEDLSNFSVEGDLTVVITQVNKKEKRLMKVGWETSPNVYIALKLGCSFH